MLRSGSSSSGLGLTLPPPHTPIILFTYCGEKPFSPSHPFPPTLLTRSLFLNTQVGLLRKGSCVAVVCRVPPPHVYKHVTTLSSLQGRVPSGLRHPPPPAIHCGCMSLSLLPIPLTRWPCSDCSDDPLLSVRRLPSPHTIPGTHPLSGRKGGPLLCALPRDSHPYLSVPMIPSCTLTRLEGYPLDLCVGSAIPHPTKSSNVVGERDSTHGGRDGARAPPCAGHSYFLSHHLQFLEREQTVL